MKINFFSVRVALLVNILCPVLATSVFAQNNRPYSATFVGRLGTDTVLVETYAMIDNNLYGKAFIRVPEDYVREFSIHFYPDGSIREFSYKSFDANNSSLPLQPKTGYHYTLTMKCLDDECTFYVSEPQNSGESIFRYKASNMDFVGGWVPSISLMEWNCMRLAKSGKQELNNLKMINYVLGVHDIGVRHLGNDTVAFGGSFIEFTKIKIDREGRILSTNGISTPWSYIVTKHPPIDVDKLAKRMVKTPGIGLPSPVETVSATVHNNKIRVDYGRPFKRGRKIFGGVVPYDSIWRTGAGSPTVISLENDILINKTRIPKGSYSLYTIPKPNQWTLIFNTDLKTWPTIPNRKKDLVQVSLQEKKVDKIIDQFTIGIEETRKGGVLKFEWDNISAYMEFVVAENP